MRNSYPYRHKCFFSIVCPVMPVSHCGELGLQVYYEYWWVITRQKSREFAVISYDSDIYDLCTTSSRQTDTFSVEIRRHLAIWVRPLAKGNEIFSFFLHLSFIYLQFFISNSFCFHLLIEGTLFWPFHNWFLFHFHVKIILKWIISFSFAL